MRAFLTFSCQLKMSECPDDSQFEVFLQIIANAIEIEIILKYGRNLGFLEKKMDFFEENVAFFKIGKVGKIAVECVSNNIVSYKCFLHLNCEVFIQTSRKCLGLERLKHLKRSIF